MGYKVKVKTIPEWKREIYSNLSLSNSEAGKLAGVASCTVWCWRRDNLTPKEREKTQVIKVKKWNAKEIRMLKDKALKNSDIAKRLGISRQTVYNKRKSLGIKGMKHYRSEFTNIIPNNDRKPYKMYEIQDILKGDKNDRDLAVELGRTASAINRTRNRYKNIMEVNG